MDYKALAELTEEVSRTSLRLKKTSLIALFLRSVPSKDIDHVMLLLQGRVFPAWDKRVLGLSEKLVVKAISTASGASEKRIADEWRKLGDIGEVALKVLMTKTQATLFHQDLTLEKVFSTLQKLASIEGHGSTDTKVKLVAQLLSSAQGVESKYVVRTLIGDLRVGIAEGTLRDAVLYAYLVQDWSYDEETNTLSPEANTLREELSILQGALDRANDVGEIACIAQSKGLEGLGVISMNLGKPLKVMLAQKVADMDEGFERVGVPCFIEYKYDGFRMQCHKNNDEVVLFTRRLEDVTVQFPDVVEAVRKHVKAKNCILDCEAVGIDTATGKYTAFQAVSQRIRRKYDIEALARKLPVELNVFDVLYVDGIDYLDKTLEVRRKALENIIEVHTGSIALSRLLVCSDKKEAEEFYKESLLAGNEGIMLKKRDASYQPGSRVGTMIKLKPVLDTFDLVIVGAEWGTGKRSGWLTSFTVACVNEGTGEYLTMGKFGTGIKEKEEAKEGTDVTFEEITELLRPHTMSTNGREVDISPSIVVEVKFEEIQISPSYTSGYALRFPRFVGIREDRGIEDMTTLSLVESAYKNQRGR